MPKKRKLTTRDMRQMRKRVNRSTLLIGAKGMEAASAKEIAATQ